MVKICKACGKPIEETCKSKDYCWKHHKQIIKYGEIKDNNPRTVFDPNEFRVNGDVTEIDTYDQFGNVVSTFIIDTEDLPLATQYKWSSKFKRGNPYMHSFLNTKTKERRSVYFYREILGNPKGNIDHINRNTLDNRKKNLRVATDTMQRVNTDIQSNNNSGIKGVNENKKHNIWCSSIAYKNKRYYGKSYPTKEEAVYSRYLLEMALFKDLRVNNFKLMNEEISKLTEEQKESIRKYLQNKYFNKL